MAAQAFPGSFQAGTTTAYLNIGSVQKQVTQAGFPGIFQASTSTGYIDIGAVQKNQTSSSRPSELTLMGVG